MNTNRLQKSLALLTLLVVSVCVGIAASTPINHPANTQDTNKETGAKADEFESQQRFGPQSSLSEDDPKPDSGNDEFEQTGLRKVKFEPKTYTQLGVHVSKTGKTLQKHLRMSPGTGLIVDHVIANSPATKKLEELDILVKMDDQLLINEEQLTTLVRNHAAGDEVEFTVIRDGEKKRVNVTLTESKQDTNPVLFWEFHKSQNDSISIKFSHEKHAKKHEVFFLPYKCYAVRQSVQT